MRKTDHSPAWPKRHNDPNQHFCLYESTPRPDHIFQSTVLSYQRQHLKHKTNGKVKRMIHDSARKKNKKLGMHLVDKRDWTRQQ